MKVKEPLVNLGMIKKSVNSRGLDLGNLKTHSNALLAKLLRHFLLDCS